MKPILMTLLVFLTSISLAQTTQETIETAMAKCFQEQSLTPLTENYQIVKDQPYWAAYNLYLQAAYQTKVGVSATNKIDEGLAALKDKTEKNSEDYTLLAALTSMKMGTMENIADLMGAQNNFYQYIDVALELDKMNPRAYYIYGLYDFYKPIQFGGGQKAQELMEKAVSLFESQTGEITWGADHAKQMLAEMK